MKPDLPEAAAAFFAAANTGDATPLLPYLVPEAIAQDEGHVHRGAQAIAAWLQKAQSTTPYRAEPLSIAVEDGHVRVLARIVGDFPQSPIELQHDFHLVDGRIVALAIG